MNALAMMAIAATTFIQFRSPINDAPLFAMKEQQNTETGETEVVFDLDKDGKKKPVGVRAYTPGSKIYRNAESMNATSNIKAGKKAMSGEKLYDQATDLLARTVYEYVNFEYNGAGASLENNRALFTDDEYVSVRDQVLNDQADLGKSMKITEKA